MSEMVERVAKAIRLRDTTDEFAMARAAISAMRDPTPVMSSAGEIATFKHMAREADWSLKATVDGWQAMIDEALR